MALLPFRLFRFWQRGCFPGGFRTDGRCHHEPNVTAITPLLEIEIFLICHYHIDLIYFTHLCKVNLADFRMVDGDNDSLCPLDDRSLQLCLIEVGNRDSVLGETADTDKCGVDRETVKIFQCEWSY